MKNVSQNSGDPCDVLVIGGGPAGSTAACLLAKQGRDVVLLEREQHPRFHIGESLLPRNTAILDRLGVREQVAAIGVHKPGAEFVCDATGKSVHFAFANALDQTYPHSWQVPRAEFDRLLFDAAGARGARLAQNTRVTDIQFAAPGERACVTATGADGSVSRFAPKFVIDASGRDTFLAGRLGGKTANKRHSTAALFGHFHGVQPRTGDLEGYISIHLAEDGWFWLIPLPNGVMSVGFVGNPSAFKGRQGTPSDLFFARLRSSPTVAARMVGAELVSEVKSAGNYAYRCETSWGEGYLMIGDAFAFVDPLFSSGVLLAMTSGELGAGVVDAWLDDPAAGRALARKMQRDVSHAMDRLGWLIYRINTPALRQLFMAPRNTLRMRDGLVSLLAGDLAGSWRVAGPVMAFKGIYHALRLMQRLRGTVAAGG